MRSNYNNNNKPKNKHKYLISANYYQTHRCLFNLNPLHNFSHSAYHLPIITLKLSNTSYNLIQIKTTKFNFNIYLPSVKLKINTKNSRIFIPNLRVTLIIISQIIKSHLLHINKNKNPFN